MAASPQMSDEVRSRQYQKKPEGENHRSDTVRGVLFLVLFMLGLSMLVAWLLRMAPESAGSSDFLYWIIP